MKKFLWIIVAVVSLSPVWAEEKKDDHAGDKAAVESTEKKAGSERAAKEAVGKGELSKKLDACLTERPESKSK